MKRAKRELLLNIAVFLILPFLINTILMSLGSKSVFGGLYKLVRDPYVFFCNTLIIALSASPAVFFKRFRYFIAGVVYVCWTVLGAVNFIVLCNRTLPFTSYDIMLLDTLPVLVKKYLSPVLLAVVSLAVVFAVLILAGMFIRSFTLPKKRINFKASLIYFVAIITLTFGNLQIALHFDILDSEFVDLPEAYLDNGFAYSFALTAVDRGVDKVDGYSENLIDSITAGFDISHKEAVKTPNIIVLQLESFFDLGKLNCVEYSADPIPNFRRLASENSSGLLTVPVIGAGTVNTEFEVMTGMRAADFGAGEYTYKTILIDNTCESLAYNLKDHGYTSHFLHNYKGTFYSRDQVYSNLGYDYFYSVEYMTGYETNANGWPCDDVLIRYIGECLDSTGGQDLVTAVSVQGHGEYSGIDEYEKHITVLSCDDESMRSSYEYYANQVYEMDIFLGELTEYLCERGEECVLVIYGDHLPSLDLQKGDVEGRSLYQTDYIIWNNVGVEYSDGDINAYQLTSKMLEGLSINDGAINSCHRIYKDDADYLFNLKALEYDTLYGKGYVFDGTDGYDKSDMKINLRKMVIKSIIPDENDPDTYTVTGCGFSHRSHIRIGYMVVHTEYVNENTLRFTSGMVEEGDMISVWEKDIGESEMYVIEKAS